VGRVACTAIRPRRKAHPYGQCKKRSNRDAWRIASRSARNILIAPGAAPLDAGAASLADDGKACMIARAAEVIGNLEDGYQSR
jgi:hypothetical protein